MKKRTILTLYWIALPCMIICGIVMIAFFANIDALQKGIAQDTVELNQCLADNPGFCNSDQSWIDTLNNDITNDRINIVITGLVGLGFYALYFIGWVGALINLSRAQQWVWFWGVFFFSGLMLLIYGYAGPEPLTPAQIASLRQQLVAGYPPAPPTYPSASVPPPSRVSSSALSILQERYARGEIDSEAYERMRAQLER